MIDLQSLATLAEVSPGEQVTFLALVTDIKLQTTATGKEYSRVYLRDDKASVSVPLWDTSLDTAKEMLTIDKIYSFGAITDTYKNATVIKKFISFTEVTDETVTRRLKQHMYKNAVDNNVGLIYATIDKLKTTGYYPYLAAVYGKDPTSEQAVQMKLAFASINHHDNYPGGLVNHIGGMLRIAAHIRNTYLTGRCEKVWDIDWAYVMAAIMLHDIGKLETYSQVTQYTVRFKDDCTLDHNKIGVGILYRIHECIPEESRLPDNVFFQLAYTICYHDTLDKLYEHKRVEDKIISYIDGLEATLAVSCSLEV